MTVASAMCAIIIVLLISTFYRCYGFLQGCGSVSGLFERSQFYPICSHCFTIQAREHHKSLVGCDLDPCENIEVLMVDGVSVSSDKTSNTSLTAPTFFVASERKSTRRFSVSEFFLILKKPVPCVIHLLSTHLRSLARVTNNATSFSSPSPSESATAASCGATSGSD
jgi:hypothetical protein